MTSHEINQWRAIIEATCASWNIPFTGLLSADCFTVMRKVEADGTDAMIDAAELVLKGAHEAAH